MGAVSADGRDRVVHVALRVRVVPVEAAGLFVLDELVDGAERLLRLHQQAFRGADDHSVPDPPTRFDEQLRVLLRACVGTRGGRMRGSAVVDSPMVLPTSLDMRSD